MKDNALVNFTNKQFGQVRAVLIKGEPWLVGKDVAEALGYKKARNAIAKHVDDEDKKDAPIQGDLGGKQKMTLINESGMYALIFGSKLKTAREFKHWVTSEVLPAIRKTGTYSVQRDERWQETRLGTKASHKPFTQAIKLLIEHLRQNMIGKDPREDGWYYGHITNLVQDACGIVKGQRDFSSVQALNKCDQCQTMIANLILNCIATGNARCLADVEAAIIIHLNNLNRLLGGYPLLTEGKG